MAENITNPPANARPANVPAPGSKPWLIAAWPGMGNVGTIAAGYLLQQRGFTPVTEMTAEGVFDPAGVIVTGGLVAPPRRPRSVFYSRADQKHEHPLIVFASESQPNHGHLAFAEAVVEHAKQLGVERIITFASMPSQMHPSAEARVYGVATDAKTLEELKEMDVNILQDGQVGGQAGVILGVAAQAGIPGMCLMGEIPFFAASVPNPGAAKSVLEAFSAMHGSRVNTGKLQKDARTVERSLLEMLERMKPGTRENADDESLEDDSLDSGLQAEQDSPTAKKGPDPETIAHVESLIDEARLDRAKAPALKKELDRLGLFKMFENEFLDLFRPSK